MSRPMLAMAMILAFLASTWTLAEEAGDFEPRRERNAYGFIYVGSFDADEPARVLGTVDGGETFGIGYAKFVHRYLALEVEGTMTSADYVPPGRRGNDDDNFMSVTTAAFASNIKAIGSLGRVSPFISVGLGFGVVDITNYSEDDLYLSDTLRSEFSMIGQGALGLDFRLTRTGYLGVELRKVVPFSDLELGGTKIEAGGESVVVAFRRGW